MKTHAVTHRPVDERSPRRSLERRRGFTLIELLVVMGIITMAAGLMAPAIADYYRNQAVDKIKGEFVGAMRRARLKAVTDGRAISVVFFREGARMFDELNRVFVDEGWRPESSDLSDEGAQIYYELGLAGGVVSNDKSYSDDEFTPSAPFVPPFRWWDARQSAARKAYNDKGGSMLESQYDTSGLVKLTFQRDGTMVFGDNANDVPTAEFREKEPRTADIIVWQIGNRASSYIDLHATGSSKSKIVVRPEPKAYDFSSSKKKKKDADS